MDNLTGINYSGYEHDRIQGRHGIMGSWGLVLPYLKGKVTLDIGCSDGLYLQYLSAGSVGIEQSEKLVNLARRKGLNVIHDEALSALQRQHDAAYEAVLFSHVMEHLDRPLDALREIHRVLIPGGTLVLGLPTEKNIFRSIFRFDYFDGTHIYSFTVRNALKLLDMTRFMPEKVFYHLPKFRGRIGYVIHYVWT